jgi:hypothetical protein
MFTAAGGWMRFGIATDVPSALWLCSEQSQLENGN